MTRTIEIDPVTRIEGHAKVDIQLDDAGNIASTSLRVLEFRGFEKFIQGMAVETMPTLTARICGTCPHAHHLVGAKTVDRVFGVVAPRAAQLQRELMNAGSYIHSHAIHFFALAGPDLLLGINFDKKKRNLMGLLELAPDLATKALRLRTLGHRMTEIIGGRGTHPVTAVAGGMTQAVSPENQESLRRIALEALELTKFLVETGISALNKNDDLLELLSVPATNLATVRDGSLDLYDGALRAQRADGSVALEFDSRDYAKYLYEEAVAHSYTKEVYLRDPEKKPCALRVGPLARLNVVDRIRTPLASSELARFRERCGRPSNRVPSSHWARLVELMHAAELAVEITHDDELISKDVRAKITAPPRSAVAHIEAPRGVLIHDYEVDEKGYMLGANLLVATQFSLSSINASIRAIAEKLLSKPEEELLNGVEFAIRCYDPCLSCSTHKVGKMPLVVSIVQNGAVIGGARRG